MTWLSALASSLCLGIAHLDPDLAALSWIGLGLLAFTLTHPGRWSHRLLQVLLVCWLSVFISQIWLCVCFANFMGPLVSNGIVPLWLSSVAWALAAWIPAAHRALPILLASLLGRWLPVRVWLPFGFGGGELLSGALGFYMGDLMHAQWAEPAMLRSVALVGLPVTMLIAAYGSAAIGEALAKGADKATSLLAVPVVLWFVVLPPTPRADAALIGVGAVHMADFHARPSQTEASSQLDLVVWPEASFRGAFRLSEGRQTPPIAVEGVAAWADASQVINIQLKDGKKTINAIGLANADGEVGVLRGKSILTPWGERPYGGIDPLGAGFRAGLSPPVLFEGPHRLIATICYEVYANALFLRGAELGGELIVNIANDRAYGPTKLGIRQATGVLALRAAEAHRPAVRASLWGQAAVISSDGTILKQSADSESGVLTWAPPSTSLSPPSHKEPSGAGRSLITFVLTDGTVPTAVGCSSPDCLEASILEFQCQALPQRAAAVVVSGHSLPPTYLGVAPEELAEAIACYEPELVVLDTCYGFSGPLLAALGSRLEGAIVTGSLEQLPGRGLTYGEAFYTSTDPLQRASAVAGHNDNTLEIWRVSIHDIRSAKARVSGFDAKELEGRLQRVHPNLIRAPLGDSGTSALFLVDQSRF